MRTGRYTIRAELEVAYNDLVSCDDLAERGRPHLSHLCCYTCIDGD